jgi:AcrR family transcriptional regulator
MVETRQRIVDAAAELFRRHGYTGVGLKEVARRSGSPIGSMYHFFPDGKDQLVAEALRESGYGYQLLVEGVFDMAGGFIQGLRAAFDGASEVLQASDFADACPIETVALEVASTNEPLRLVTADIFEAWVASATSRARAAGLTPARARALAFAFIAALEGAFVLSRAMKSIEPMKAARDAMVAAAEPALAKRRGR